jgi:hypothetical protein
MTEESRERVVRNLLWQVRRAKEMGGGILLCHKFHPVLPPEEQSEEEKIMLNNNLNIVLLTPELLEDPGVTSSFRAFHEAMNRRKAELGIQD